MLLAAVAGQAAKGSTTVSVETVLISAAAVILAALIAAVAAERRLNRQLAAEKERLEAQLAAEQGRLSRQLENEQSRVQGQLDAESDRLKRQLEHDRNVASREQQNQRADELRAALELAAVRYTESLEELDKLRLDISHAGDSHARDAAMTPFREHLSQLTKNTDRLAVRLGSEDPIVERYDEAVKIVREAEDVLLEVVAGESLDPERSRILRTAVADGTRAQRAFYRATSERIGPDAVSTAAS